MSSPNDISLKDIPTEYVLNKFSTDSYFMKFANGIIITNFRIDRYRREKKYFFEENFTKNYGRNT